MITSEHPTPLENQQLSLQSQKLAARKRRNAGNQSLNEETVSELSFCRSKFWVLAGYVGNHPAALKISCVARSLQDFMQFFLKWKNSSFKSWTAETAEKRENFCMCVTHGPGRWCGCAWFLGPSFSLDLGPTPRKSTAAQQKAVLWRTWAVSNGDRRSLGEVVVMTCWGRLGSSNLFHQVRWNNVK